MIYTWRCEILYWENFEALEEGARALADAPSLELFKAKLGGVVEGLVAMAVGLELDDI